MSVVGRQDRQKRPTGIGGFSGDSGYSKNRGNEITGPSPPYLAAFICEVSQYYMNSNDPPSFEEFVGALYPSEAHNPLLKEEGRPLAPEGALH